MSARSDWDAIVIGSGLGGLTAAAYLEANGLRTLVLEQYRGGRESHVFRRKHKSSSTSACTTSATAGTTA